jgi:two-component system, response regulator PdtaR
LSAVEEPAKSGTGGTVVSIVEDEALVALALQAAFADAGHRVLGPAATAEAAWRLARVERPAPALVDVVLAGRRDGVALARALRRGYRVASLFFTAWPKRARAARGAAVGLVEKPCAVETAVRAAEIAAATVRQGVPLAFSPPGLELFP